MSIARNGNSFISKKIYNEEKMGSFLFSIPILLSYRPVYPGHTKPSSWQQNTFLSRVAVPGVLAIL